MPAGLEWAGEPPPAIEKLTARGPVLVHFGCIGHAASVRTLPYAVAWHLRYAEAGLTVLGVNSPRFPVAREPGELAAALERIGVRFPVTADNEYTVWRAYGCEGWPSTFLWGQGGTLRWFQFGEGEYAATEGEIRALLPAGAREAGLPTPLSPLRPADAPGAKVIPPTAEILPGGDPERPLRASAGSAPIELGFEGAGVAVTAAGPGELAARLDGGDEQVVEVGAPGVYELAGYQRHGSHRLSLRASPGLEIYCLSFAPGVA